MPAHFIQSMNGRRSDVIARSRYWSAADRVILETDPPYPVGLPEVPTVEDRRGPHDRPQPFEVQELELVPLGDQRERVAARRRLVRRVTVDDFHWQQPAGIGHRDGIVRAYPGAQVEQAPDQLDALRFPHVVGVG